MRRTTGSNCHFKGAKDGLLTSCLAVVGRVDGCAAAGCVLGRRSRIILLQQVEGLMSMTALCMFSS